VEKMGKDPAFLFYPSDFIVGTMFFSDEEVGKYIRLLCVQHQHNGISAEIFSKCNSLIVREKFVLRDDGKYINERLQSEIEKRHKYCESRRQNKQHMLNISSSYVEHMENENRNENRNKSIRRRKIDAKPIEEIKIPDHLSEIWPDFIAVRAAKKAVNSPRAIRSILNELNRLTSDPSTQIKIIEQSIRSSWKDVYPIKPLNSGGVRGSDVDHHRAIEEKYGYLSK
jgi:uncharacterized protein YdaU (DUF1376 family)